MESDADDVATDDRPAARTVPAGPARPVNIGAIEPPGTRQGNKKYGYLPDMARASRGNIGSLPVQSFCERVISAANIDMTNSYTI